MTIQAAYPILIADEENITQPQGGESRETCNETSSRESESENLGRRSCGDYPPETAQRCIGDIPPLRASKRGSHKPRIFKWLRRQHEPSGQCDPR